MERSSVKIPIKSFQPRDSGTLKLLTTDSNQLIKLGIWLYFLLVIFEGALRKWFLPSLSTPLLLVRDPLALWLIMATLWKHKFPANPYVMSIVLVGVLSIFTAILFGHGDLVVALFGARILLLHFPLMFVFGQIFNRDDVIKIGIVTLWITIPMTLLIASQFFTPQSSLVNRGVGGDMAGSGFSGALGYFRPSGTFSFTNGTSLFYGFAACFIVYFLLTSWRINRFLLVCSTVALIAAVPLSISRTLFLEVGISVAFSILTISKSPKYIGRFFLGGIVGFLILIILSQLSFFQTSTEAFTERFTSANTNEGGLEGVFLDRFLGGLVSAFLNSQDLPFFGYGIGFGTSVGSQLLTGNRGFLVSEEEWGRLIGELGQAMGILIIFLRVALTIKITVFSYKKIHTGDILPWMLTSFGMLLISQAQWAQPTALGFSTLIGGLMIASLRR